MLLLRTKRIIYTALLFKYTLPKREQESGHYIDPEKVKLLNYKFQNRFGEGILVLKIYTNICYQVFKQQFMSAVQLQNYNCNTHYLVNIMSKFHVAGNINLSL